VLRLTVLLSSCALLGLIAAPALAEEETASDGDVSATFSYDQPEKYQWENMRLAIAQAGVVVYDEPVSAEHCEEPYCAPSGVGQTRSVRVQDLDGDGGPEVILDLFTGGAHCCHVTQIFADGSGVYRKRAERNFGDPGYRLNDLDADGEPEFVGADFRFDYQFSAFAFSGAPIRIYAWRDGTFRQVTDDYRSQIRADAALWMKRYRRASRRDEPQGVLAAWAADEYRLGRRATALRFVRSEIRSGKLRDLPGRGTFVHRLDRTLKRWGY
jgi:hypothetical protein